VADVYVALVHYPVYDKHHNIVTTSITSIDVHDIARSCRTYGVSGFYVVTPVDALRGLARKVLRHWQEGAGRTYNPNRKEALDLVQLERTVEGVQIDVERATGQVPISVATSARPAPRVVGFQALRTEIAGRRSSPYLLLLGTGWGLTDELVDRCDRRLEPIAGAAAPGDATYNHLSVRAAAAVILDRLLGTR
jgi:hypothetical protein